MKNVTWDEVNEGFQVLALDDREIEYISGGSGPDDGTRAGNSKVAMRGRVIYSCNKSGCRGKFRF